MLPPNHCRNTTQKILFFCRSKFRRSTDVLNGYWIINRFILKAFFKPVVISFLQKQILYLKRNFNYFSLQVFLFYSSIRFIFRIVHLGTWFVFFDVGNDYVRFSSFCSQIVSPLFLLVSSLFLIFLPCSIVELC